LDQSLYLLQRRYVQRTLLFSWRIPISLVIVLGWLVNLIWTRYKNQLVWQGICVI
jgi:hypothetical protein